MGSLCSREGRCVARARTFEIDVDLLARRAAPGGSRPRGARGAGRGLRPAPRGINAPASASASTSASGSAWAAQGGGGGSGGSRRRRRRGWRQEERGECTVRREEEEELRRRHRRRHRRWPSISLPQATGTFTVRGISGSGVCRKAIGRWACRASGCPVPAAERLTASATPRKRRSQNCATSVLARRLQLRPHALGQHSQLRPSAQKWVALLLLLFEQFLVVVRSPAQKVDV